MCMFLKYITIKLKFNHNALFLWFIFNAFFLLGYLFKMIVYLFEIQQYLNDAYNQTTLLIQLIY